MLKRDFYNRVARGIELKRPDISVAKNTGYHGETLRLTVYKQLEPLRTNSLNVIRVTCDRNVVTVIAYDTRTRDWKALYSDTIDYKHNQINMVSLTVKTVLNQLKGDN